MNSDEPRPKWGRVVLCAGMPGPGADRQFELAARVLEQGGYRVTKMTVARELPPRFPPAVGPAEALVCRFRRWDPELAPLLASGVARALYSFCDVTDAARRLMAETGRSGDELLQHGEIAKLVADGEHWLAQGGLYSSKAELAAAAPENEIRGLAQHLEVQLSGTAVQELADGASAPDGEPAAVLTGAELGRLCEDFFEWRRVRGYADETPAPRDELADANELCLPHVGWMQHPVRDDVAHFLRQGHYETDLQAFCWLYLRSGDRVLDVGAHFGLYTRIAAACVGETGAVQAIEPNPKTYALLRANCDGLPLVAATRGALSDRAGRAVLQLAGEGREAYGHVASGGDGAVIECQTLDDALRAAAWPNATLAKVDTEGHEFRVLAGAASALRDGALPVIAMEFAEENLLRVGRTGRQLATALEQQGYTLAYFDLNAGILAPFRGPWPVWYLNLFAVRDLAAVNLRLQGAPRERQRIVRDLAARHRACASAQRLAELNAYRRRAAQHERWAQEAEKRARRAMALAAEQETWARSAEARAEAQKKQAAANEQWARASDQHLAALTTQVNELKEWAEAAEKRARDAAALAGEQANWAREAEARAEAHKKQAIANEKWAREAERRTEIFQRRAAANEAWARDAEARADGQKQQLAATEAWARDAEHRARSLRDEAADLRRWAMEADERTEAARQLAEERRKWAEDAEARAENRQQLAAANESWARRSDERVAQLEAVAAELRTWAETAEQRATRAEAAAQELARLRSRPGGALT